MKVYLDSVSTTKARSEVLDTYKELLDEYYYNNYIEEDLDYHQ